MMTALNAIEIRPYHLVHLIAAIGSGRTSDLGDARLDIRERMERKLLTERGREHSRNRLIIANGTRFMGGTGERIGLGICWPCGLAAPGLVCGVGLSGSSVDHGRVVSPE